MTENEKAATYIGWNDHQVNRCESRLRTPQGTCWTCGAITPADSTGGYNKGPHDTLFIPAPDMSDPRNYMKALEAVRDAGRWWNIEATGGDRNYRLTTVIMEDRTTQRDTPEEAIVGALAALYDAENGNEHDRK